MPERRSRQEPDGHQRTMSAEAGQPQKLRPNPEVPSYPEFAESGAEPSRGAVYRGLCLIWLTCWCFRQSVLSLHLHMPELRGLVYGEWVEGFFYFLGLLL